MGIVEAIVGACPLRNGGCRGLAWALVVGLMWCVGAEARAQGTSGPLWATSVPQIPNPPGGWNFEEQAEGNPGCGDPCTDCNDGNETYAVNPYPQSPSSREVEPLVATNFQGFSLPAGNRISRVRVDVLGRYNSGDMGEVRVQVVIPGVGTLTRDSGPFSNTTSCRYILDRAGLDDITNAVGCGWTQAMVNGLTVRVARIRDDSNTNLRIKAFRLIVDYAPDPQAPTGISVSSPVCANQQVTLMANGGSGDSVQWFIGACGGAVAFTGNPFTFMAPQTPTTYFARWHTTCQDTACAQVTISPIAQPAAPSSITASPPQPCVGAPFSLTANGGSGRDLQWFVGGCGGTPVFTGNPYVLPAPPTSTIYQARWVNECGQSLCTSITITPVQLPTPPTRIDPGPNPPCIGQPMTLTAVGGSGTSVQWFAGTCGGTPVFTGNPYSPVVSPTPTTYMARWTSSCGDSTCVSLLVSPISPPTPPTGIVFSPPQACPGAPVTLHATGGTGDTLEWFRDDCSGTPFATGNDVHITALPATARFCVRWRSSCGVTACICGEFVPLQPPSAVPDPAQSRRVGETVTMCVSAGGSGPFGYQWSRGGQPISNGDRVSGATTSCLTITQLQTGDTGTYCCRVTGVCAPPADGCVALAVSACQVQVVVGPPPETAENSPWPVSLHVVAVGEGPLTYLWKFNGSDIPDGGRFAGARTPQLTINNTMPADSGDYTCRVTDSCGSDESDPGHVTVYCTADFNRSGAVNSQDFFDFLDCFFSGCTRGGDFNRDGFINSQDLFDFLAAFFRPCQ